MRRRRHVDQVGGGLRCGRRSSGCRRGSGRRRERVRRRRVGLLRQSDRGKGEGDLQEKKASIRFRKPTTRAFVQRRRAKTARKIKILTAGTGMLTQSSIAPSTQTSPVIDSKRTNVCLGPTPRVGRPAARPYSSSSAASSRTISPSALPKHTSTTMRTVIRDFAELFEHRTTFTLWSHSERRREEGVNSCLTQSQAGGRKKEERERAFPAAEETSSIIRLSADCRGGGGGGPKRRPSHTAAVGTSVLARPPSSPSLTHSACEFAWKNHLLLLRLVARRSGLAQRHCLSTRTVRPTRPPRGQPGP